VGQHSRSEQAELLLGKIPSSPGQLGPANVPANLETVLQKLDGCQYEEIRALVILSSSGANPCHHIVRQLQLVH